MQIPLNLIHDYIGIIVLGPLAIDLLLRNWRHSSITWGKAKGNAIHPPNPLRSQKVRYLRQPKYILWHVAKNHKCQ